MSTRCLTLSSIGNEGRLGALHTGGWRAATRVAARVESGPVASNRRQDAPGRTSMADPQSYKSHAKNVPLFHYVLLPILLVNLVLSLYHLWRDPVMLSLWNTVMAFAFIVTAFFARVF